MWWRTRRTESEHVTFGGLCLGLAVHAWGAALLPDATGGAAVIRAAELRCAGGIVSLTLAVDFCARMFGQPSQRHVMASYVAGALGLLTAGCGWMFAPASASEDWHAGGALGPTGPTFRAVGLLVIGLSMAFTLAALTVCWQRSRSSADARMVLLGLLVPALAGVHDAVFVHTLALSRVDIAEHAGLVPVVLVGAALIRRFARSASELDQRTAELRTSHETLREAEASLVRKTQLAAVGELSAVIAHEVRNALSVVKNATSSLRRPGLVAEDRAVLLTILDEETARLLRLVHDLLAYARPVSPVGTAVPLEDLVRQVFEPLRANRDAGRPLELELELDPETRTLLGDTELLRRAFACVVDNAGQAMPDGGRLRVRAMPTHHAGRPATEVAFIDDGEGMIPATVAKALDPFFTTRAKGTGLGLAIVERIIRGHGGTVSIESAPGTGTTLTLTLPRAE